MVNTFLEAINNSQIIGMVIVDFRKAFDLVDHTFLLKNIRSINFEIKQLIGLLICCIGNRRLS